jgi:hypothetical protein
MGKTINLKENDIKKILVPVSLDEEEIVPHKISTYDIKVGDTISYNGKTGTVKLLLKKIICLTDGTRLLMKNN